MNNPVLNVSLNARLLIGSLGLISLLLVAGAGPSPFPALFSLQQSNTLQPAATTAIDRAVSSARARISNFATTDPKAFSEVLQQAFGNKLDTHNGHALTQQAARSQLPFARHTVFVPAHILEGASGAYAAKNGGLILLDEALRADIGALSEVILHEWAHHLDATLGPVDAIGEEGDIFLMGISHTGLVPPEALLLLRQSERGHTAIQFRGEKMAIEQGFFGDLWGAISKPFVAPFKFVGELVTDPIGTLGKVGKAIAKTVENVGGTIYKMGEGLVKTTASLAVGDYKGALGNALNVATGPGNLLNKTAAVLNKVTPALGTLGNIALGFTPAGPLAAGAQGLSDTVSGFKNGGLKGGFTALGFAALDVGMSGASRTNKGLKAAGWPKRSAELKALANLGKAPKVKPTTWYGKSWAGIKSGTGKAASGLGKLSSAIKKRTPILKNLDKYKLTKATKKEIARGKKLMVPDTSTTRTVLTTLDKAPIKFGIGTGVKGNIAGRDRDEDGNLLGTGGSSNDNTIDGVKDTFATDGADTPPPVADNTCPNDISQREMIDVQRELSRLRFEPGPADGMAGAKTMGAIKTFQEGCQCLDSLPPGCVSAELLATLKATKITCDDSDRCALRLENLTGNFFWWFDIFNPTIVDPMPIVVRTPPQMAPRDIVVAAPPIENEACTAEPGDLNSLRKCCDAEGERALAQCQVTASSEDIALGTPRCKQAEIDAYNACLTVQQRRKVGTTTYTERASKPLKGNSSGVAGPGSVAQPASY